MEIEKYLQFLLPMLCVISCIPILIFFLRKNDNGYDYNKIIRELNVQKRKDLDEIDNGNKLIDEIEKEIRKCKKVLGMNLVDKQNSKDFK